MQLHIHTLKGTSIMEPNTDIQTSTQIGSHLARNNQNDHAEQRFVTGLRHLVERIRARPGCVIGALPVSPSPIVTETFSLPGSDYSLRSCFTIEPLFTPPCGPTGAGVVNVPNAYESAALLKDGTAWALTTSEARQIAYFLARVGWTRVQQRLRIYRVYQILDGRGAPALKDAARYFYYALTLQPKDVWTLAQWAEVYRDLGNAWHALGSTSRLSTERLDEYLTALMLFDRAIKTGEESGEDIAWAAAHYGATVVNVRGFMGIQAEFERHFEVRISEMLDLPVGTDPKEIYSKLLESAVNRLEEAQRLRGFYYPWAQAYGGGASMLFAVASKAGASEFKDRLLQSLHDSWDAANLDPNVFGSGFEPAELHVNGYYTMALVYLWRGELDNAWGYVSLGLRRTFNFNFIPGLEELAGLQILILIAAQQIDSNKSKAGPEAETFVEPRGTMLNGFSSGDLAFSVPLKPIADAKELVEFIRSIFHRVQRTLEPFLAKDWQLNTVITMGFESAIAVLLSMASVIRVVSGDQCDLADQIFGYVDRLRERLGTPEATRVPARDCKAFKQCEDERMLDLAMSITRTGRPSRWFSDSFADLMRPVAN